MGRYEYVIRRHREPWAPAIAEFSGVDRLPSWRLPVKVSLSWDDVAPMAMHDNPSSNAGKRHRMRVYEITGYTAYTDDELIIERDRQRKRLDELTLQPGTSPSIVQLLVGIEGEVERMTDELMRRARARHPASRSLTNRLGFGPSTRPQNG